MESHCYIISYDLCQPSRDYYRLYQALQSFPHWGRLTESTWAIVSTSTSIQIRDYLAEFMDNNDRLIVILSGKSAAWTKLLASSDWVRNNLAK